MEAFLATLGLVESLQNSWFDGLSIFWPQNQELSLVRVTEKNTCNKLIRKIHVENTCNRLIKKVVWPVRGSNPRHSRY